MIVCKNPGDGDVDREEEVGNRSVVVVLFAIMVVTHENDGALIFISDSMESPA
jgi:hypothetical protein